MCGIFGVLRPEGLDTSDLKTIESLASGSERRGSDTSGLVAVARGGRTVVWKGTLGASELLRIVMRSPEWLEIKDDLVEVFGHSRMETHGGSAFGENNQPIVTSELILLHNGIVFLEEGNGGFGGLPSVAAGSVSKFSDTFRLGQMLTTTLNGESALSVNWLMEALSGIRGEYSIFLRGLDGSRFLATNVGNLYHSVSDGGIVFASEGRILTGAGLASFTQLSPQSVVDLGQGCSARVPEVQDVQFSGGRASSGLEVDVSTIDGCLNRLFDTIDEQVEMRVSKVSRCSMCLLPSSFPGMTFDEGGVCELCRSFRKPEYAGVGELENSIRKIQPDGRVLVALSGGRDSCFALKLMVDLGLSPVAYTYDWGMVTTAARENMARLCGDLGVEHVLVSADIRKNRAKIGRALRAWLPRPDLATLPILMAGDKPYFRFAAAVSHELGGIPIIMADHALETTGFKSALAGARPTYDPVGGVKYRLSTSGLARLAIRYGASAALNPRMIPSMFDEGLRGFRDYYLAKHEFIRPFEFLEWDESDVESALSTHGWTTGDPSKASWRMGDATAPFYNVMYLLGIAMTEHDALRSNQIRFGYVSRESALEKLPVDNRVDRLGVVSYFVSNGIDPEWALRQVVRFGERGRRS